MFTSGGGIVEEESIVIVEEQSILIVEEESIVREEKAGTFRCFL